MIQIQCSNGGTTHQMKYAVGRIVQAISNGWDSYGNALYCPECCRTWEKRNGKNKPLSGKWNTMRIIDEIHDRQQKRRTDNA